MRPSFRLRGLRAAQLLIASVMLAAPASAIALTTGEASEGAGRPALSARVSAHHVALGHPLLVDGHASAHATGSLVELQTARMLRGGRSAWRRVATGRIGRHGGWSFQTRLRETADVRAVELLAEPAATAAAGRAQPARTASTAVDAHQTVVSEDSRVQVRAQMHVGAGEHTAVAGHDAAVDGRLLPARAGRVVAVQAHDGRGWQTVGQARTGVAGGFSVRFRPPAGIGRRLRAVFTGDRLNDAVTDPAGEVTAYDPVLVSWYDDAGSTACGFHAADGVASRTLPCGTKVAFRDGGRSVTATVDDRGPYVGGREFDLDQTTAGALGFSGVGVIDASLG